MSYRNDFMGNYPPGAANDPNAPWNEKDPPEKLFGITVSCSLSKDTEVTSNNYDETGFYGAGSLNEPWITSTEYDSDDRLNCPWDDYTESEYTPSEIIEFAKQCAEYMLSNKDYKVKSKYGLKKIIDSCTGWNTDEENAEQV